MTRDPLDDVKALMDQATPAPDAGRKAATLVAAEKIFEASQGLKTTLRPIPDRPKWAARFAGVTSMFAHITTRPGLTVTTGLLAVGLVAILPVLRHAPPAGDLAFSPPAPPARSGGTVDQDPTVERGALADAILVEPALPNRVADRSPVATGLLSEPSSLVEGEAPASRARPIATMQDRAGRGLAAPTPKIVAEPVPAPPFAAMQNETFATADPSPVKIAANEPVSTFSIDVDTASYAVVRSSLTRGVVPQADAVRIEELINYFPYDYPAPGPGDGPFRSTVHVTETPWNPDTQLLHIAIQGQRPTVESRPPLNLVFLIDTSGSMDQPNKLPLLKQSFRLMLGQLSDQDQVSIVTYAGSAGRVLDPTPASNRATILAALERLDAGGSTAGQAGLQQAYATAAEMAADGEVTRVILATDGDFNVGLSDPDAFKDYIATKRGSGTYLSVLGFGRGNLDDATMQALAQNGNGTAAYIDTLSEAQKVLVDQLTGALFPIANDVKIQVEFNPANVAEYRLLGYETRALRREDFNNDRVDAGEIGAGHSVTALYEVTPVGSPAVLNDALRYASEAGAQGPDEELAFLRLRYKTPGETESQLIEHPIAKTQIAAASTEIGFAAAIAGFGQILRGDTYLGDWSYQNAIALATDNIGDDPFGYRREAVQFMRLAASLSE